MIQSCKYCLSQRHLCPRCEGPVIVKNITITDGHGVSHSTSLILCDNLNCANYGEFKQQTIMSVEVYVCDECKREEVPV